MNSLILDLFVISVFGIFIFLGFKNGVINAFLSFASSVFAGILSVYFAGNVSSWVYFGIIGPAIRRKVESLIVNHSLTSENFLNHLPKFITEYLNANGITSFSLDHIINNNAYNIIPQKVFELFAPVVINALKSVFVVVLFVIFIVLSKVVIRFILRFFKSSLIRKANTLLGCLFGFLKAYVVLMMLMCCVRSVFCISGKMPDLLSEESISNTAIFKGMYNNNPVYEFFEFM